LNYLAWLAAKLERLCTTVKSPVGDRCNRCCGRRGRKRRNQPKRCRWGRNVGLQMAGIGTFRLQRIMALRSFTIERYSAHICNHFVCSRELLRDTYFKFLSPPHGVAPLPTSSRNINSTRSEGHIPPESPEEIKRPTGCITKLN